MIYFFLNEGMRRDALLASFSFSKAFCSNKAANPPTFFDLLTVPVEGEGEGEGEGEREGQGIERGGTEGEGLVEGVLATFESLH